MVIWTFTVPLFIIHNLTEIIIRKIGDLVTLLLEIHKNTDNLTILSDIKNLNLSRNSFYRITINYGPQYINNITSNGIFYANII